MRTGGLGEPVVGLVQVDVVGQHAFQEAGGDALLQGAQLRLGHLILGAHVHVLVVILIILFFLTGPLGGPHWEGGGAACQAPAGTLMCSFGLRGRGSQREWERVAIGGKLAKQVEHNMQRWWGMHVLAGCEGYATLQDDGHVGDSDRS